MASSHNSSSQCSQSKASRDVDGEETHETQLSDDEVALAIRMYNLVGPRWGLIAGRIPGRSAEEIKNYWMSRHATSISTRRRA